LQESEYRAARNAANNFVLAFMRDTSGAAYGAKEMYDHARAFLPEYGDDAKILAQKAEQRRTFVESTYGGLGPGKVIADASERRRNEEAAAKQTAIDTEMKDVTPAGVGDVKTNTKTGVKRIWNGKNWVDF
jgi:hypothetical protein